MKYGKRLSDVEYEQAIVDLYKDQSAYPSAFDELQLRRKEHSLRIDHRLGIEFPSDLRDRLWIVQEKVEQRRILLLIFFSLVNFFIRFLGITPESSINSLATYMQNEYAKVIGEEDAREFFLEPNTGKVAERFNAPVSKTGDLEKGP